MIKKQIKKQEQLGKKNQKVKSYKLILNNLKKQKKIQKKMWLKGKGLRCWYMFFQLHYKESMEKVWEAMKDEEEELRLKKYLEVLNQKINNYFKIEKSIKIINDKNKKSKEEGNLLKNNSLINFFLKNEKKNLNISFTSIKEYSINLNYFLIKTSYMQKLQKKIILFFLLKDLNNKIKITLLYYWKFEIFKSIYLEKAFLNLYLQNVNEEIKSLGGSLVGLVKRKIRVIKEKIYLNNFLNNTFCLLYFFKKIIELKKNRNIKIFSSQINFYNLILNYKFKILDLKKNIKFRNLYNNSFILLFLYRMEYFNKKGLKNPKIWKKGFNFVIFVNQISYFFFKNIKVNDVSFTFLENFLNSFSLISKNILKKERNKQKSMQHYLWKRGNLTLRKSIQNQRLKKKKSRWNKIQKNRRNLSSFYFYLIKRLEDKKIRLIKKNNVLTEKEKSQRIKTEDKLSKIYEFLILNRLLKVKKLRQHFRYNLTKLKKKEIQQKYKTKWIKRFKRVHVFLNFLKKYLKKNKKDFSLKEKTLILKLLLKLKKKTLKKKVWKHKQKKNTLKVTKRRTLLKKQKIKKDEIKNLGKKQSLIKIIRRKKWNWNVNAYHKKVIKNVKKNIQKKKVQRKKKIIKFHNLLQYSLRTYKMYNQKKKKTIKKKKAVKKNAYLTFKRQKELLFLLLNRKVSIYYINALSLTRYSYIGSKSSAKIGSKWSGKYLKNIERDMINRFKYIAIYIQDLVRIGFIAMFLKKATFLVNFIAFQLEKLPKNRKETKFLRFVVKLVKISAAQRTEMIGLRIKFKGRVNRWRRTKAIVGTRGVLSYYTYNSRIEYGTAKAITRKGALGISLWISYHPIVKEHFLDAIYNYQKYSKILRWKALTKYYNKFLIKK